MDQASTRPMSSGEFMERISLALRPKLPPPLGGFRSQAGNCLVQIYYDQPTIRSEVWSISRLGRLEMGLHFESKDRAFNERMFLFFERYTIEMKAQLGKSVQLERWDKGWSRIFQSIPYPALVRRPYRAFPLAWPK